MKKNFASLNSLLFIVFAIALVFIFLQPQRYDTITEAPLSKFSTQRALQKIKIISEKPHYVGSKNHDKVANYLIKELTNLGLQPIIQEGFTLTERGNLAKSKNIYATIKGSKNTKSLLLLSHYDSAPHSFSKGASDNASGVATVLETVRAFMHSKTNKSKNDIVILFTDAEELGLNGAALFATKNKLADNIGLALNFEARGTSGPSYMLMETTNGNSKMVDAFSKAKVKYPVSNSLMYSIYKMLPNDTDLTVLREQKNIQGFNFAFIDGHFNYHTSQDNYQNVNPNSVAHQGSYLVPLLDYFSDADLKSLKSKEDKVYFSLPFLYLSYSNQWILPVLLISLGLFFLFIFIGLGKQIIQSRTVFIGFGKLFLAILLCGGITFFGWKIILAIYPQYAEIQQGFPYNGHFYIYAFLSLSVAICFLVFGSKEKRNPEMSLTIAPISIWFLINTVMAIKLEGASFLIIPVIFSVIMLAVFVLTQKKFWFLNCLLSLPAILLIVPLIQMFPVGLGLKILFGSTILVALTFALLLPIFGGFLQKKLCSLLFVLISIGFFIAAHLNSEYTTNQAKPNSLLYSYNTDTKKAFWLSYDQNPDAFTKTYLGENPQDASVLNNMPLFSKYNSQFTLMAKAPIKNIASPTVVFSKDSISGNQRYLKITIMPNRKVNRYDIFASLKMGIFNFKANGVQNINQKSVELSRNGQKILSYYVVNNEPLILEFSIPKSQKLDLRLLESSFDLFSNPNFNLPQRSPKFIPAPFVLTDAVCIIQKIKPTKLVVDKETADNTDLPLNKRNMVPNVFAIDTLKNE
jgi:hypothetical protein